MRRTPWPWEAEAQEIKPTRIRWSWSWNPAIEPLSEAKGECWDCGALVPTNDMKAHEQECEGEEVES